MTMLPRIPTGIPGFDPLCEGGLIRDRTYVVEGEAGAGKSIFGLQFLLQGALQHGEAGILVATEEPPRQIRENASIFGWDLAALEQKKKLVIIDASSAKIGTPSLEKAIHMTPFDVDSTIDQIITLQEEIGATRCVVDSTTAIGYALPPQRHMRTELLKLVNTLAVLELTTIETAELKHWQGPVSDYGLESFVAQGVITLHNPRQEKQRVRGLEIRKMRGSNHSKKVHPFDITPQGIVVHPEDELYGQF